MKVLTWNIKGGAAFGWSKKRIEVELVNEFVKQEADVIVLTEFVVIRGIDYLFERLEERGYLYFTSGCSGKNGILIAIRRSLTDDKKLMERVYETNLIDSHTDGCNLLRVELPLKKGGNLIIMGCRMETELKSKSLEAQYDGERKCFDQILIPAIRPLKADCSYIVCGDFNNARCRGKLNEAFQPQDYIDPQNQKRYAQYHYNLNIIKDEFEKIGFEMADKRADGSPIPTKGMIPDDHIFVKGLKPTGKCQACKTDLSDHDLLLAELK